MVNKFPRPRQYAGRAGRRRLTKKEQRNDKILARHHVINLVNEMSHYLKHIR